MQPQPEAQSEERCLVLLYEVEAMRKRWHAKGARWRRWQFFVVLMSIILSVFVASFGSALAEMKLSPAYPLTYLSIFSALNAICIGALSAFNMGTRATDVRQATRMLDIAILKYRHTGLTKSEFIKTIEEAQTTMGHPQFESVAVTKTTT